MMRTTTPAGTTWWFCRACLQPPVAHVRPEIRHAGPAAWIARGDDGRERTPTPNCPARSHCQRPPDRAAAAGWTRRRVGIPEYRAMPGSLTLADMLHCQSPSRETALLQHSGQRRHCRTTNPDQVNVLPVIPCVPSLTCRFPHRCFVFQCHGFARRSASHERRTAA